MYANVLATASSGTVTACLALQLGSPGPLSRTREKSPSRIERLGVLHITNSWALRLRYGAYPRQNGWQPSRSFFTGLGVFPSPCGKSRLKEGLCNRLPSSDLRTRKLIWLGGFSEVDSSSASLIGTVMVERAGDKRRSKTHRDRLCLYPKASFSLKAREKGACARSPLDGGSDLVCAWLVVCFS